MRSIFQTRVMVASNENLMRMGLDAHPIQHSVHLVCRTGLGEITCMDEDVTCRKRRKRGMGIVSVGYADQADGVA
jgi:hypothetical protein